MVAARLLARDHNKKKEYEKTAQKHNGRCARLLARDHNNFELENQTLARNISILYA